MKPSWNKPYTLLVLLSVAMPLAFSTWMVLLNNFVVEKANFTGAEIGTLQSIREIPGFLAFTVVFALLLIREQKLAILSAACLAIGVAITGLFPSMLGLYLTTFIMSVGFHYLETIKQSLSLQWLDKQEAPRLLGKLIAVGSATSIMVYLFIWQLPKWIELDYEVIYLLGGGLALVLVLIMWLGFSQFPAKEEQHKKIILRKRYWLFYVLTFLSGARRQIFVVFAGFMMVEKFGYSYENIALLLLINHSFNWLFAAKIGGLIGRFGERKALTFEYVGLIVVFTSYAFVTDKDWAAALYIIDHLFFALMIAIKTYFQKIAHPKDIASSAAVSFTINHIAAVVIPVLFGLLWLVSPTAVFLSGAGIAFVSLIMAQNIPVKPEAGNEVLLGKIRQQVLS